VGVLETENVNSLVMMSFSLFHQCLRKFTGDKALVTQCHSCLCLCHQNLFSIECQIEFSSLNLVSKSNHARAEVSHVHHKKN
jgi:hypothetical protein